jgi:hypothetical protein
MCNEEMRMRKREEEKRRRGEEKKKSVSSHTPFKGGRISIFTLTVSIYFHKRK